MNEGQNKLSCWVRVLVWVCVHVCMSAGACMSVHLCECVCTHVCMSVGVCMCVHACMSVGVCACTCVWVCACVFSTLLRQSISGAALVSEPPPRFLQRSRVGWLHTILPRVSVLSSSFAGLFQALGGLFCTLCRNWGLRVTLLSISS